MPAISESLDQSISSVDRLRGALSKSKTKQVTAHEDRSVIKATALSWFNGCRRQMADISEHALLQAVDSRYQAMLEASEKATLRSRYSRDLKLLKASLVKLRSHALMLPRSEESTTTGNPPPPDFARLIPDPAMQAILKRRWSEVWTCITATAYLAATVMMGALLEALLLARINRATDKSPIFASKCAPKDRTGKTRPLQEWTLNSYIDVAHDLRWIGKASRDVGVVLRDYRNFIHPEKELSQGVSVGEADCRMFGAVLTALADQVVNS